MVNLHLRISNAIRNYFEYSKKHRICLYTSIELILDMQVLTSKNLLFDFIVWFFFKVSSSSVQTISVIYGTEINKKMKI